MMGPRLARASRLPLLLALASLCIAGLAAAGERLRTGSDTEEVSTDENGLAKAKCPRGTRAVSGGFASEFTLPSTTLIDIDATRRSGRRAWTSSGFNAGTPGDLTSFAYCRDQVLTTVKQTVPAPVGDFATATAKCPRGTKVMSGGFRASPSDPVGTTPVLYISESRRASKREWETSAFSNGNEHGELTTTALCGKARKPATRSASILLSDAPPNTPSDEIVARCKRGQRAVSGGFGSPDDSGDATPAFKVSKKVGRRGWKVAAFYGNNAAPIEITAYAYCERR